jgi:hypothetical protein
VKQLHHFQFAPRKKCGPQLIFCGQKVLKFTYVFVLNIGQCSISTVCIFVQNHEKDYQMVFSSCKRINTWLHTAAHTRETHHELKVKVHDHPAHSLYSAPSDFHLFACPKRALRRRPFSADDEIKETVHDWLRTFSPVSFSNGIIKLVGLWKMRAQKQGYYTEEWYTYNLRSQMQMCGKR